ncbi:hypothetical protein [Salmonirosea aquatica]|uniref:Uncharacterized protein n=1 Tax=Salmonirosea aquatica TaxID=2654236 RepID=A0A7C9BDZ8_9BACT|nr:hypothetical protein [Cytophagaceae bacterium SJW1-29]
MNTKAPIKISKACLVLFTHDLMVIKPITKTTENNRSEIKYERRSFKANEGIFESSIIQIRHIIAFENPFEGVNFMI